MPSHAVCRKRRRSTLKSIAGALALVLPLLLVYIPQEASAAPTRTLTITQSSAQPVQAFQGFDGNPAKVFDFDGDGDQEIIAQNDNQWVYVFDSRTGKILAQMKTVFPGGWGARSFNGPEAAVMTVGGQPRLIVANSAATITSYRFDAAGSTGVSFLFVKEWERRLTDCHGSPGMDSKPVFADLDKDGTLEILAQTEELGVYALRASGAIYWKKCIGGGNGEPTVGDLNLDGWPDVVWASDGGTVTAMNGRTGGTMWSYWILGHFDLHSASMPVGVGMGQLDGVGGPDVVVGARDSHDDVDWEQDHALLIAFDSAGRVLWAKQDPQGNPLTYTHAVVVDAENDGEGEVYWGDWNTIGHKPPADEADAWKTTGPANFYRYDKNGNMVWRQTLGTFWSNKDVPLADIDGDGVQEMLANGPGADGHDGIWPLDVRTGAKESFIDLWPYKMARAPVVADLWGTGTMQFVVEVGAYGSGSGPGILVYDTGKPYSSKWPHLPYPPTGGSLPPPPPPPSGQTFGATFNIKSPNQWWQEVTIQPDSPRTITSMDLRIEEGFWEDMSKSSWGAWTSSFETPAGTKVEFLATDSTGAQSQSLPFTWLDGTLSQRSTTGSTPPPPPPPSPTPPPPPPPPGPFGATFTPSSGSNEWWVEVSVAANEPVTKVEVQVNGGAYQDLPKTSWGTWAKSFYVQRGSEVQFRATGASGGQDVSGPMPWLGPAGPFAPTFDPRSETNNWWVEVAVTAGKPIASVDAQVNGGAWTNLPKTSWGTYAKSFFVADGSQVTFRATSTTGETGTSASYTWG